MFHPLNYVELLMYTDLQPENGYVWVNSACAEYYGKESVTVTIGEQSHIMRLSDNKSEIHV